MVLPIFDSRNGSAPCGLGQSQDQIVHLRDDNQFVIYFSMDHYPEGVSSRREAVLGMVCWSAAGFDPDRSSGCRSVSGFHDGIHADSKAPPRGVATVF